MQSSRAWAVLYEPSFRSAPIRLLGNGVHGSFDAGNLWQPLSYALQRCFARNVGLEELSSIICAKLPGDEQRVRTSFEKHLGSTAGSLSQLRIETILVTDALLAARMSVGLPFENRARIVIAGGDDRLILTRYSLGMSPDGDLSITQVGSTRTIADHGAHVWRNRLSRAVLDRYSDGRDLPRLAPAFAVAADEFGARLCDAPSDTAPVYWLGPLRKADRYPFSLSRLGASEVCNVDELASRIDLVVNDLLGLRSVSQDGFEIVLGGSAATWPFLGAICARYTAAVTIDHPSFAGALGSAIFPEAAEWFMRPESTNAADTAAEENGRTTYTHASDEAINPKLLEEFFSQSESQL